MSENLACARLHLRQVAQLTFKRRVTVSRLSPHHYAQQDKTAPHQETACQHHQRRHGENLFGSADHGDYTSTDKTEKADNGENQHYHSQQVSRRSTRNTPAECVTLVS
jgi:hypothetical protein